MKIKNIIVILALSIFTLIILQNKAFASDITINPSIDQVEEGETFSVYINSNDLNIAALTMQIYFDSNKIEYIKENENTNLLENSIVYTWVAENGGKEKKQTEEIIELKFKAKEEGTTSIVANGEFYNSNGENIDINFGEEQIQINKLEEIQQEVTDQDNNIKSDNSFLEILRLDKEGITPNFNKEITEYYITVDNSTNNLQVTAIPENRKSKIEIKGNNNLKSGINKIEIIVTSEDDTQKKVYNINVTKTSNLEASNTNLVTLAIENATLYPEFYTDILNYKAEVSNDVKDLNILAIPEKVASQVSIQGNTNLKEGKNTVIIKVIAENKITEKNYIIEVYRRNSQEEVQALENQEIKIEKANAIIEEKEQEESLDTEELNIEEEKQKENETFKNKYFLPIILVVLIVVFIIGYYIYKKRKKL